MIFLQTFFVKNDFDSLYYVNVKNKMNKMAFYQTIITKKVGLSLKMASCLLVKIEL